MLVQFNNLFTVFASSMNCTVCIDPPVAVVSRVATGPDFQARVRLPKPGPGPARPVLILKKSWLEPGPGPVERHAVFNKEN